MRDWEIEFLRRLRDASSDGIVQSQIAKRCRDLVESLQACGAAGYLPSPAGRGLRFRIQNESAFERFVQSRCPSGLNIDNVSLESRADGVAHFGDAKAFSHSIAEGVFLRATKPNIVLRCEPSGSDLSVSDLTSIAGCAAIKIADRSSSTSQWSFTGSIAVIENADAFWLHERVLPDVDLAVFASGRMSGRLLGWLSSSGLATCPIIHWGDYDPVGVAEYIRLTEHCGDRVQTFVPDNLESLLKRHGKRKLITDQVEILGRLRQHSANPHVARMIALFDKHRKGLEQELLLVEYRDQNLLP